MKLADKTCSHGGSVPPLKALRSRELLKELGQGWKLNRKGHLERRYTFTDFAQALSFANKVGAVAEAEGHHPDLSLAWGKCKVEIWSHKIKGLTESDFVLAAKAERKFKPFRTPAQSTCAGLLDEEAARTSLPDTPVVEGRRHAVQLLDVSVHPSGMLFAPVTSKGLGMLGLSFSDRPTRQRSRWLCPWLGLTQIRCGVARSKWFMRTLLPPVSILQA